MADAMTVSTPEKRLQKAREIAKEEHLKLMTSMEPQLSVTSTPFMSSFLSLPNLAILNRIYVGSIQFDVSEVELQAIFGAFGPIRSVNMMVDTLAKRHKGYGFIEYETAEAASLAQANMDGSQLAGRAIKVGRPANFPSDLPPGVPKPFSTRIYVANVHELIQEEELKAIFEAFGSLSHCNLLPDTNTRQHKGCAYVEFKAVPHALSAIQALHGFELAGRPLKVGKTIIGGPIPMGMSSLADLISSAQKPRVPSAVLRAAQQINATITGDVPPTLETSTILLCNLDDYAQASSNASLLQELEEDIREECTKYGSVIAIKAALNPTLREVQCTVQFADSPQASQCFRVMDKRWFGGRQISTLHVPNLQ